MRKILYPLLALVVILQLVVSPLSASAAEQVYFTEPEEGKYEPLHPYTLNWTGNVLVDGGYNLSTKVLHGRGQGNLADIVITDEEIGANAIIDLGPNASLTTTINPDQYRGWKTYVPLRYSTYLIKTHDNKYAKVKITDIQPGRVYFQYVMETDAPVQGSWKEFSEKYQVPRNKEWRINFSREVDATSVHTQNVYVTSESGSRVNVLVKVDPNNSKTVLVHPPSNGYEYGKSYTLYVQNIKEKETSKLIKENVKMKFTIEQSPVQPKPPTNIVATGGNDSINISWTNSPDNNIKGYYIYTSTDNTNFTRLINTVNNSYLFNGSNFTIKATNGQKLYIYIVAVDLFDRVSIKTDVITVTPIADIAPNPPRNIIASPYGDEIDVSWDDSTSSNVDGYRIYISTDGVNFKPLRNSEDASDIFRGNYVIIDGYSGKTVYLYVVAVNKNGTESAKTTTLTVKPGETQPNPPSNLKAIPGDGVIDLSWSSSTSSNISGYYVYARYDGEINFRKLTISGSNNNLFTGNSVKIPVTNGQKVFFYVTAVNTNGKESSSSFVVSATATSSSSYTAPVIHTTTPGNGTIKIEWFEIYDPNLLGYYVYLSEGSTNNFKRLTYSDGNPLVISTEQLIDSLKNGTKYYLYVSAVYKNNQIVDSNIVSTTTTTGTYTDWSGTWSTDYGTMQLKQLGYTVVGTYKYGSVEGTITGTVDGYTLKGKFSEPGNTGDIEFMMTTDKTEFLGKYRNQYQTIWAPWDGERIY
ncbi:fibronectin type 3 domain-containing protein [Ureibacillus xyleni]|uniref:Fibronectin type 3 domain-containing protein n=1 Tax=Ureibacillus xyleni TaxID=614648 RepID=A0A285RA31_9BACL|nr:Ig-like domain-containing protein [Ureibacillus xyleni]SOB90955.1 fibronectin type 3 domain-containing protein [Ureibacillus xyleni]